MKIEDCFIGQNVGVYSKTHGVITGKLIDLNIDFEEILKNIQKVYDLTNSDWVMSRKNNKNF